MGEREGLEEIDAWSRKKVPRLVEDLLLSYDKKGIKIFIKEKTKIECKDCNEYMYWKHKKELHPW